ncbi:MAG: hypothetical protein RLZZ573_981 [Pseudomonadota bacterium]|jgi:hypothetical protein
MLANADILIEKIQSLPPERLAEVDDFVDFLRLREREISLTHMATQMSAPAFAKVWDNPEDEAYDAL